MFLDSDDTYYPKTIETCLKKMEEHNPDIVIFRMAFLKENDTVQEILTDRSLWNPMVEEVVLNGDEKYCDGLYSTLQFSGSNKMFKRDLIRNNGLSFNEKINMAEDAYFVMLCYENAKKIVVLPQFVGHCYFLNATSSVQSPDKPREVLLQFCYGFKLMFELLIDNGAPFNHFVLTMMQAYIMMIYGSSSITLDDWKTIQDEMRPYVEKLTPPPVNKYFTKEQGEQIYEFVRKNILEPKIEESLKHHDFLNGEEMLLSIIRENSASDFGQYYGFDGISSIGEFKNKVPVYNHESFDKLIKIQTTVGEKNVYTTNRVNAYAYDIDESDEMKTIPVSEKESNAIGNDFLDVIRNEVTFLMMEALPKGRRLNDYTYNDSITGIRILNALGRFSVVAMDMPGELTAPFQLIFPKKEIDAEYLNILFALRNPDVTQIVAANTWVVLNYFEKLFTKTDEFCDSIETGTVTVADKDTLILAKQMVELWIPDRRRAAEIREAVATLPRNEVIKAIWPNLKKIIARDGGRYELYSEQLKDYTGDIEIVSGNLITPFGMIAEDVTAEHAYKLSTDKAFYEFLPMKKNAENETLLLSDLKCGEVYELVITNHSGVYRMRTNILIKPVRLEADSLYFVECERPVYDENGVLITNEQIHEILKEAIGDELYDYSYHFRSDERRLSLFVETGRISNEINNESVAADIYRDLIGNRIKDIDGIDSCDVCFLEKETRLLHRDMRRYEYMIPGDCVQPVRNLNDKLIVTSMEAWKRIK